jgi:hypothetical protein
MRKFNLVDFAAHYQKGFRNHVVAIGDVPALVESFKHYGCYSTYFFFSDEILTYMSAQTDGAAASLSGYEGKVRAPFFPLDLDHPELTPALEAAKRFYDFFRSQWFVDPGAVQIYFSGSKGIHLMLDTRLFGRVAPAKNLPVVFDSLRRHLAQRLPEPLRPTVDLTIKDRVRLLRLPNTIHEKSKLYKIILSPPELESLGPQEIRDLARRARPLLETDSTGLVSHVKVAASAGAMELFERVRRQAARLTRKPFAYRFRRPADPAKIDFRCAAMRRIWGSRIEPGYRNNCAIRLASEFRLLGLTREETETKLLDWNERHGIELPTQELQSVVQSAYQHRFPYRFSCRDPILRHFCPLPDLPACRRFTRDRSDAPSRPAAATPGAKH